jgi:hypothetical protein
MEISREITVRKLSELTSHPKNLGDTGSVLASTPTNSLKNLRLQSQNLALRIQF